MADMKKASFDIIKPFVDRANSAIGVDPDDYVNESDGLIYCGKCHTPKQYRGVINDKEFTVMCLCECQGKARKEIEDEAERQQREARIKDIKRIGFYSDECEAMNLDNDDGKDERVSRIIRNYIAKWDEMRERSKGLLLYGDVGTGKTFYAACIANALMEKGVFVLMTNFSRLSNTLMSKTGYERQNYIDRVCRFPLLIIDDLAAERDTEWMNEVVQNVIDERYRAKLPIIITTNLTPEEIKFTNVKSKQRTYSRLLEMCYPVAVKGDDRRKDKLRRDFDEISKLLGANG